jgi:membrane-bound lytic murein transglycosylase D
MPMSFINRHIIFLSQLVVLLLLLEAFNNLKAQVVPTEQQIRTKLEELNKQSPIRLDYNKNVQAYIDVYTIKRREHLGRIIGRSQVYFPMFEAYLDKYNLTIRA